MIFPLLLASFLPIRTLILPKIIESKYLQVNFSTEVYIFLSDPSGTDLSLVFSPSPSSSPSSPPSRPVSDYYYKCLLYHIQA